MHFASGNVYFLSFVQSYCIAVLVTQGSERADAYAALLNYLQNSKRTSQTVVGFNVSAVLMYGFGGWNGGQIMPRVQLPAITPKRKAWDKGRLIGQKRPLLPKKVWAIRTRLEIAGKLCPRLSSSSKVQRKDSLGSTRFCVIEWLVWGTAPHRREFCAASASNCCASTRRACLRPVRPHSRLSPSGLTLISFASAAKVGFEPNLPDAAKRTKVGFWDIRGRGGVIIQARF
jgi:hypothetical protein